MKKYITYKIELTDKISPFNNTVYGWIRWFDGTQIVGKESGAFGCDEDAWAWIKNELKELENN